MHGLDCADYVGMFATAATRTRACIQMLAAFALVMISLSGGMQMSGQSSPMGLQTCK